MVPVPPGAEIGLPISQSAPSFLEKVTRYSALTCVAVLATERQVVAFPPNSGSKAMTYYRLYVRYDGPKGPIVNVHEIDAADDKAAIRKAATYPEDFLESTPAELRQKAAIRL